MRIAVVCVPSQRKAAPDYVQALAKGMESMGHHVEIIDAWTDDGYKLPSFEYIAVVAESLSFFSSTMPSALSKVLSAASVTGKKSAAFLKKGGLFGAKALAKLMRAMEKEGMYINWSDVILNAAQAEALGKRIGA